MQKDFYAQEGETLSQCLEFIHESLSSLKLGDKERNRAELMCEESLVRLMNHGDFSQTSRIRINIRKFLGNVSIDITVPGQEFNFHEGMSESLNPNDELSPDAIEAIQNMIMRSFGGKVSYRHSRKYNIVTVKAVRSEYSGLYMTLGAFILAVIAGFALKGTEAGVFLNSNILEPVKTIFMNGLKLCAVPVVFFAVVSCFADAGSLSGIKRTGSKVMMYFMFTQIFAILTGLALMLVFRPGAQAGLTASSSAGVQGASVSIMSTITGLIPSDIVRPFLEGNILQVIVLAVLAGSSIGATSAKSVRNIFDELNRVFMDITRTFIRVIPLVVFCSIASLVLTTGTSTLLSVMGVILMLAGANIILFALYWLMVKFLAHLNPAVMYRKSMPALITAASTCSSVAALPDMIKSAENMGIPPSVYSFTLPLGITIGKNISAIYIIVGVMFTANLYGITFSPAELALICIFTLIIVMAAPNIPGGAAVSMSIILANKGLPLDAVPLFVMIGNVIDPLDTATVCAEPLAAALVVSAREKLLSLEAYLDK
ncbi:MAG: dicarboxylate/amino acid:cation symporter [Synergistaceae bacterium]|nr:dicarboxylate/amino acid:cation symporter [Synergistaceae bacterium]